MQPVRWVDALAIAMNFSVLFLEVAAKLILSEGGIGPYHVFVYDVSSQVRVVDTGWIRERIGDIVCVVSSEMSGARTLMDG